MAKNNASIYDNTLRAQAGVPLIKVKNNPVSRLDDPSLKDELKVITRINDEASFVNRYVHNNLPDLSSRELERMLYYKGQLVQFWFDGKFYYMPYTLCEGIDFYGRFRYVHPVPFMDGTDKDVNYTAQKAFLSTLKLKVYYEIPTEELTPEERKNACVIIRDYTPQLSQIVLPRVRTQEAIIDLECQAITMSRTALKNATGVKGMKVESTDEAQNVEYANDSVDKAVLNGQRWVPIRGGLNLEELAGGSTADVGQFLQCAQAYENIRLGAYGLPNGGLFQKAEHVLQSEHSMNLGAQSAPLMDGLYCRQEADEIANILWGTGQFTEISEQAMGGDLNGDGVVNNELSTNYPQQEGGVADNEIQ